MTSDWIAAVATLGPLALYEAWLLSPVRRASARVATAAHATMRAEWFAAVGAQKGSEILAVQTLRNALMSSSLLASTAALALMGAASLSMPSLREQVGGAALVPRAAMELALLTLLFAALVASVMSARYFNHASFVGGMPVHSDARLRWAGLGSLYARRAGALYGWALRQLVLVGPAIAFVLHPWVGPLAAAGALSALVAFDQFDPASLSPVEIEPAGETSES